MVFYGKHLASVACQATFLIRFKMPFLAKTLDETQIEPHFCKPKNVIKKKGKNMSCYSKVSVSVYTKTSTVQIS